MEEFATDRCGRFDTFEHAWHVGIAARGEVEATLLGSQLDTQNPGAGIDFRNTHLIETAGIDGRDELLFTDTLELGHDGTRFPSGAATGKLVTAPKIIVIKALLERFRFARLMRNSQRTDAAAGGAPSSKVSRQATEQAVFSYLDSSLKQAEPKQASRWWPNDWQPRDVPYSPSAE